MGRAKLKLELIEKEKSREQTYKKRKEGLLKKLDQLSVLCGVPACAIIYGPKQENDHVEPEIWPQSHDEVVGMIKKYKERKEDNVNRGYGVNDYFDDRKKNVEDQLAKLRRKKMEDKYPTELVMLNTMSEGKLRLFAETLSIKAKFVRSKIEILKGEGAVDVNNLMHFGNTGLSGPFYPHPPLVPIHTPIPINYHHQQLHAFSQNNSKMMRLTNAGDQFGGGSTSRGNFQRASFWSQVSYEAPASSSRGHGVVDPMIYPDPRLLACYDRFNWMKYEQKDNMGATTHPRINIESGPTYFSSTPSNYNNIRMDHSSLALQPYLPEKMISNSSCTSSYSNPGPEFLIDQVAFDSGFSDADNCFSPEQGSPNSKTK